MGGYHVRMHTVCSHWNKTESPCNLPYREVSQGDNENGTVLGLARTMHRSIDNWATYMHCRSVAADLSTMSWSTRNEKWELHRNPERSHIYASIAPGI